MIIKSPKEKNKIKGLELGYLSLSEKQYHKLNTGIHDCMVPLKEKNKYSETNKIYFEISLLSIMSNSYILKVLTASFYGKPFCGEKKNRPRTTNSKSENYIFFK